MANNKKNRNSGQFQKAEPAATEAAPAQAAPPVSESQVPAAAAEAPQPQSAVDAPPPPAAAAEPQSAAMQPPAPPRPRSAKVAARAVVDGNAQTSIRPKITKTRMKIGKDWYSFVKGKDCLVPQKIVDHLKRVGVL